ncbi:hypothetical protein NQ315_009017 [Exocentrus adspersus]|uniref:Endonuclease/exonuclease/phosphatase domain-containing protein n=1 Tax=Exocentrus adspersus TaxID=1586481 RepID=A0AAV8VGH5_9CUCU|nr:hypothetical protein NQ315_009017 [Exocentrus adspersus]
MENRSSLVAKGRIPSNVDVKQGSILIECKDKDSLEKLRDAAVNELSEDYDVHIAKLNKPKVIIRGVHARHLNDENEFLNKIQGQYYLRSLQTNLEIKFIRKYIPQNKTNYNVIVEVSAGIFNSLIICISETHITSEIADEEIEVPGYKLITCYSNSRYTGGVIIYIKDGLTFTLLKECTMDYSFWLHERNIIFGGIYRSPNAQFRDFEHCFEDILNDDEICKEEVIIMGDINSDYLSDDAETKRLKNIIDNYIVTNNFDLTERPREFPKVTDHDILAIDININFNVTDQCHRYKRNLNAESIENILQDLVVQNWNYTSTDVDKSEEDWVSYTENRNKVVTVTRKEKTKFYEDNIDRCAGDSKKMWRIIKSLMCKTKTNHDMEKVQFQMLRYKILGVSLDIFRHVCESVADRSVKLGCSYFVRKTMTLSKDAVFVVGSWGDVKPQCGSVMAWGLAKAPDSLC